MRLVGLGGADDCRDPGRAAFQIASSSGECGFSAARLWPNHRAAGSGPKAFVKVLLNPRAYIKNINWSA